MNATKYKEFKSLTCPVCKKPFTIRYGNIVANARRNKIPIDTVQLTCSNLCKGILTGKAFHTVCAYCGCPIRRARSSHRSVNSFCNQSCAARFNNHLPHLPFSQRTRKVPKLPRLNLPNCDCKICKTSFYQYPKRKTCSKLCYSITRRLIGQQGGKVSASVRQLRSKDERALFDLCSSHFHKAEHNKVMVDGWDADIVINDKHLVLWNGPWHYREMNMTNVSLKQIQNRDRIKINKFTDLGYFVYVYEDRYFTPDQAFDDLRTWITY